MGPNAIRPSPLLVWLAALTALVAAACLPLPMITAPTLAIGVLVALLAALDWIMSGHDPAPHVERTLPLRLIKDRSETVTYRIARPGASVTTIDILDELPAALGGDLRITGVRLGRDRRVELARAIQPNRRGTFELGPILILWRSHLGLLSLRAAIAGKGSVRVLPPASIPQRRSGLTHRSVFDELGIKPRPLRGEGTEFESLREYVSGDDPRHIDWRASARSARLQVRSYQSERRHTVMIAIDTGRLMGAHVDGASKLDHAINCAAALARASIGYGDRVGFLAFDSALRLFMRPRSGSAGVGALVEATSPLKPASSEADYRILAETLARYQAKRALVVVLTDFVEGGPARSMEDYLAALARRHCVMLVAMRDRILSEVDRSEPAITRERLYRRLALQDVAAERETVLARIARFGAQVLDLDPAQITAPVLNRYLAIRDAALI
ncbi:MAG TPA: DUF58 domain-containing protein [Candidatus Binataceae bacterium]|nr:DUF58 domain-containing protein [Candidatus Binataceae bacterium]